MKGCARRPPPACASKLKRGHFEGGEKHGRGAAWTPGGLDDRKGWVRSGGASSREEVVARCVGVRDDSLRQARRADSEISVPPSVHRVMGNSEILVARCAESRVPRSCGYRKGPGRPGNLHGASRRLQRERGRISRLPQEPQARLIGERVEKGTQRLFGGLPSWPRSFEGGRVLMVPLAAVAKGLPEPSGRCPGSARSRSRSASGCGQSR